ncbi:MAG: GGDEF domain-containing protein [Mycobacterium leprae]
MSERWTGAFVGCLAVGLTYGVVRLWPDDWWLATAVLAVAGYVFGGRVRKWRRMALCDELTGLYNRRPFEQALKREWDRAARYDRPLSLLFLDVDDFGLVNKVYGHLAGDATLRVIARQLRHSIRSSDILARWGGEEFVVLLPDTTVEQAVRTAERIRRTVEQASVNDHGRTIGVTVSTGVAGYPGTAESPRELLRQAIAGQATAKGQKNAVAVVC